MEKEIAGRSANRIDATRPTIAIINEINANDVRNANLCVSIVFCHRWQAGENNESEIECIFSGIAMQELQFKSCDMLIDWWTFLGIYQLPIAI